jgi:hypothetical protein
MKKFALNLEFTEEKNVIFSLQMPQTRFLLLLSVILSAIVARMDFVAQYMPVIREFILRYARLLSPFLGF